jgi:four helix bundle protein
MENTYDAQEKKSIRSFEDLTAWQEGHKLVLLIYRLTKSFPREECFGLTSQLRRAGVSITSNLAEGFSRASRKEKLQFYTIALGSLMEVQSQLLLSRDIPYITKEAFEEAYPMTTSTRRLILGLKRSAQSKDE